MEESVKIDEEIKKHVIDENKVMQTIIVGSDWQDVLSVLVSEENMDPLSIDIIKLADVFMSYLQKLEKFDFRVPARFILVAAVLLRMKTEMLLEEEEKKQLRQTEQINPIKLDEIPTLTAPMMRKTTRNVTLDDLIGALNKAFAFKEKKETKNIRMKKAVERLIGTEEDFEERIDHVYGVILKKKDLMFSELVPSWHRMDIVKTLLPLLHLMARSKVFCDQQEMFEEISIKLSDENEDR